VDEAWRRFEITEKVYLADTEGKWGQYLIQSIFFGNWNKVLSLCPKKDLFDITTNIDIGLFIYNGSVRGESKKPMAIPYLQRQANKLFSIK
jgi:hypothetical protein